MSKTFSNTWGLILGGSSGLGLATAQKLAAEGMNLIIVHRDRKTELENIEKKFEEIRSHQVQLITYNENAIDESTRKKIVTDLRLKLGESKIYCLVHSIAKGNLKTLASGSGPVANKSDFDITFHAMASSWWEWTKELLDEGLWAADARNLSFTSEGNKKYIPHYVAVSAAKAGLEVLNRYMAVELAPIGIKTNVIQSGVVETPSMKMIPNSEKIIKLTEKRNPFTKLTQPEDVANVVYLLCRAEAKWINGAVIVADGGESLL
jgi:enoyl-[acyl-carrier protein] reductase III